MTTTTKRRFNAAQLSDTTEGHHYFVLTDEDKQKRMALSAPKGGLNEAGVPHFIQEMVDISVATLLFKEANPDHSTDCPQCKGSGYASTANSLLVCYYPGCDARNSHLDWQIKNPLDEIAEITYTLRHEQ